MDQDWKEVLFKHEPQECCTLEPENKVGDTFARLFSEQKFCDTKILISNDKIKCHKVVLIHHSKKLEQLIEKNKKPLDFRSLDANTIKTLIEGIYKNELSLSAENFEQVLTVATELGFEAVIKRCYDYVYEGLDVDNLLAIRQKIHFLKLTDLEEKVEAWIFANFEQIAQSKALVMFDKESLKVLIESHDINVSKEFSVLQAVLNWCLANWQERREELPLMLQAVRFKYIPSASRNPTWDAEPEDDNFDVTQYIKEQIETTLNEIEDFPPRKSYSDSTKYSDVIICACGTDQMTKTLYIYDIEESTYYKLPPLHTERKRFDIAFVRNTVYVIGGYHRHYHKLSFGMAMPLDTLEWEPFWDTHTPLGECKVAVFGNKLFALGEGVSMFFDLDSEQWEYAPMLSPKRTEFCLTVADGFCYVIGGRMEERTGRRWSVDSRKSTEEKLLEHRNSKKMKKQRAISVESRLALKNRNMERPSSEDRIAPIKSNQQSESDEMITSTSMDNMGVERTRRSNQGLLVHQEDSFDEYKQWMSVASSDYMERLETRVSLNPALNVCDRTSIVERIFCDRKFWQRIEPMHYQRGNAAAAVIDDEIVVFGGRGVGYISRLHDSVETYKISKCEWVMTTKMSKPRCQMGVTAIGSKIYVAGGYGEIGSKQPLHSMEHFRTSDKQFKNETDLPEQGACTIIGAKIATVTLDKIRGYNRTPWEEKDFRSVYSFDNL